MNNSTAVRRTAQKRRVRGLAVVAAALSIAVISSVDTTAALDADVSMQMSAQGRHVHNHSPQPGAHLAAGGHITYR